MHQVGCSNRAPLNHAKDKNCMYVCIGMVGEGTAVQEAGPCHAKKNYFIYYFFVHGEGDGWKKGRARY